MEASCASAQIRRRLSRHSVCCRTGQWGACRRQRTAGALVSSTQGSSKGAPWRDSAGLAIIATGQPYGDKSNGIVLKVGR